MKKKLCLILICFCILFSSIFSVSATTTDVDEIPFETYTYWTGITEDGRKPVQMKQVFKVKDVIYPSEMGDIDVEKFVDVCCGSDGKIYLLDSDSSLIVVLNSDYSLHTVINGIKSSNDEIVTFKGSRGIYVDKNNYIYIAGAASKCVWKIDINGILKKDYLLPDSNIIPKDFQYSPIKVTVDKNGYVYILSDGSYYGAILYSPNDEFLGFYGANTVNSTVTQAIQQVFNRLFTNDIKKSQSVKALPYQFTDLVVDSNNFIYTATGATQDGAKGQIKRLNPGGKNVFTGNEINYADEASSLEYYGYWIGNNLSEIAVSGDFVYGLSTVYGKVFVYNTLNELICVFGGGIIDGEQKGVFKSSCAIEAYGNDIYVLDNEKNSLTVFGPTEYGAKVMSASSMVIRSNYIGAKSEWSQILENDSNNQLAYKYLAKAAFTEKDYVLAMEYSKAGYNREIYEQAFEAYRDGLIRKNFGLIILIVILLIALIVVCFLFIRKRNIKILKNKKINLMFSTLIHPFDAHTTIKTKKQGSILICLILLTIYFVTEIVKTTHGGFIYTYFDASTFNALFVLAKTIGVIGLWVVVNWAVSTLFGGIGKIKELFIVTCYSLLPMIIGNLISVIATNALVSTEASFLNVLLTVLTAYTFILIAIGTIIVHDFSFSTFVGTTVLTVAGMAIVVFVGFLIWMIIQQLFGFLGTIANEIIYR